jgi:hypothetical protein
MAHGSFQRILFMLRERERRESFNHRVGVITDVDGSGKSQQGGGSGGGGGSSGGGGGGGAGGGGQQGKEGGSKATKIRVQIGVDPKGKPVKSPWFHPNQGHGQDTQQKPWKPGMNYQYSAPGGDLRQITGGPYAPNDEYDEPDHAMGAGDNATTSQNNKLRTTSVSKASSQQGGGGGGGKGGGGGGGGQKEEDETVDERWIGDEKEQKQQGGAGGQGGQSGGGGGQQKKENKPQMITRMSEKGGFTARVGNDDKGVRVAAHPKGGKVAAGEDNCFSAEKDKDSRMYAKENNWVKAKDGQNYVDKPWQIKKGEKDPVPNDNEWVKGKERKKQERQGGSSGKGPSSGAGTGSGR